MSLIPSNAHITADVSNQLYRYHNIHEIKFERFKRENLPVWALIRHKSNKVLKETFFYGDSLGCWARTFQNSSILLNYINSLLFSFKNACGQLTNLLKEKIVRRSLHSSTKQFAVAVLSTALSSTGMSVTQINHLTKILPIFNTDVHLFQNVIYTETFFHSIINSLPYSWFSLFERTAPYSEVLIDNYRLLSAQFVKLLLTLAVDTLRFVVKPVIRGDSVTFEYFPEKIVNVLKVDDSHSSDLPNISQETEKVGGSSALEEKETRPIYRFYKNVWLKNKNTFCEFWNRLDEVDESSVIPFDAARNTRTGAMLLSNKMSNIIIENCRNVQNELNLYAAEFFNTVPLSNDEISLFLRKLASNVLKFEIEGKIINFYSDNVEQLILSSLQEHRVSVKLLVNSALFDCEKNMNKVFSETGGTNSLIKWISERMLLFVFNLLTEALRLVAKREIKDGTYRFRSRKIKIFEEETTNPSIQIKQETEIKKEDCAESSRKRKHSEVERVEVTDDDLNEARALRPSSVVGSESVSWKYSELLKQFEKDDRIPEEWVVRFRTLLTINTQLQSETENLKNIADMFL